MAKLYGSQFPSRSAFLRSEEITTEYGEAIALYERTGRKSLEWQKELLSHIMAQNEDKLWTHTKFGYSIPRRNGKSEILIMRILYGCCGQAFVVVKLLLWSSFFVTLLANIFTD